MSKEEDVSKFKEGYREARESKNSYGQVGNFFEYATKELQKKKHQRKFEEGDPKERGKANAYAANLMRYGEKEGEPRYALAGAELYDALGKGDEEAVQNRLYKSLEKAGESGEEKKIRNALNQAKRNKDDKFKTRMEEFIRNNQGTEKKGSLENLTKTSEVSAGILGIAGSLFFLSPNITGNSIGTLSTSTTGFLGALCFVAGLVFLILGVKK